MAPPLTRKTEQTQDVQKQLSNNFSEGCWKEISSKGQRSSRTNSQPLQPHISSCYRNCNLGTAEAWTSLLLSLHRDLSLLSLYMGFSCPLRIRVPSFYFPCTVSSCASAQRCPWSEGDTHQRDEAFNLHLNPQNWSHFSPGATSHLTPISQEPKHRALQGHSHERQSPLVNRKHFLKATTSVPNSDTAGKRVPESS